MNRRGFLKALGIIAVGLPCCALKSAEPVHTLRAGWTIERAPDLKMMYEEDLTDLMAQEVVAEIDREVMMEVRNVA